MSMPFAPTCHTCGGPLSISPSGQFCPVCLLTFAGAGGDLAPEDGDTDSFPRPFGEYELLAELGRGGMGLVFKARQRNLDRIVALKVLLTGPFSDDAARQRFRLEAQSAAQLQHPNIVAIHDVGEADGHPYLTMDFVDGPNLAARVDGQPLAARVAAGLLRDIARAIEAAHAAGVLHRDLKPSNILIGPDERPRVTDFGLAKRLDGTPGVTQTGQTLGSPNYVSPEQAAGRNPASGITSDVYGLGAILYHLVTGRAPFNAPTAAETLRLVLETDPPSPRLLNPALPRDLETICLKCLQNEPAQRYPSAAAVVEDLDRFLSDRPIHAHPPGLADRAGKYARRNGPVVIAASAVFGSLAIGLGFALVGYRRAVTQQRATQAARAQAEELVGVIMRDVQPALEPYGRLPVMEKIAEASLHYFEQLPPELRNSSTDAALATALDSLAVVKMQGREGDAGRPALLRAKALWKKVLAANPRDADAAAASLINDSHQIHWILQPRWEEKVRLEADLIARYREWCGRFPAHLRLKYGLAEALIYWSFDAGYRDHTVNTLAGAQEAHAKLKELVGEMPGNANVQASYLLSYVALIAMNQGGGDATAENIRLGEGAVAFASERLQKDPGNRGLLEAAARASSALEFALGPASARRAHDAGLMARGYLATLVEFDPANRAWRFDYAKSFLGEAGFLRRDGQLAEARRACAQAETQMLALGDLRQQREAENPGGPKGFILDACMAQAECAASLGDAAEADASLARAATWCDDLLSGPDEGNPGGANFVRGLLWAARIRTAENLRDWRRLARVAGEAISAIDAMPVASTARDLAWFREAAVHAVGKAKLRQGDAAAALPLLQGDDETLAEALTATGDIAKARQLLEPILAAREKDFTREPDLWEFRFNLARTSCLLAKTLDPANVDEAARRKSQLSRAAELLGGPEAEPRLTPADRELKTQIATLR